MGKRRKVGSKRKATKKGHPLRNLIIIAALFIITVGLALITGNVPDELLRALPPALQQIVKLLQPKPPLSRTPGIDYASLPTGEGNTTIESFSKSKKLLLKMYMEAGQFTTFYCGSKFDEKKKAYHDESGYKPATKDAKREARIEWEHITPAYKFGITTPYWVGRGKEPHPDCFTEKGKPIKNRSCAEKNSKVFRRMQADMHNLVPAIGSVNGLRLNYDFGMIPGEEREFGSCNMEIESKIAEPPDERWGEIARTYLYMALAYPDVKFLSDQEISMFQEWAQGDPPDAWECEREKLIADIQGNRNHVVQMACEGVGS